VARWGNGNVRIANDSANGNWTYGYDHVNRLSTTAMTGQSFTYSYDRYGNMSCAFQGLQPCVALSFDPATNRISDPTPPPPRTHFYDNAGNLTADGIHGYVYDGENRLACVLGLDGTCTSATATNYFYDPQGRRVAKVQGSTREEYVYDPQGHVISARDASGALLRTEFYAGDRHVATWNGNGLFWNHADWLGTERVRTDASRVVREICTDTPFGMNLNCTSTDQSPIHFAGLQYDPETQQSHALYRQYVMGVGRWLTPDPAGKAGSADLRS
jgi:RHS repeat-associated protein